jgi:hypothetical protein
MGVEMRVPKTRGRTAKAVATLKELQKGKSGLQTILLIQKHVYAKPLIMLQETKPRAAPTKSGTCNLPILLRPRRANETLPQVLAAIRGNTCTVNNCAPIWLSPEHGYYLFVYNCAECSSFQPTNSVDVYYCGAEFSQ